MANIKGDQPPVHTIPSKKAGWDTVQDGEILNHKNTKADAMAVSREEAMKDNTTHQIHKLDGTITGSKSYSNDLNDTKD